MNKMIAAVSLVFLTASSLAGAADWSGKVLKLGVDPTYPPLEYKNQDGTLTGFGVDIAEALCAELKARCVWVESSWDGMIPALLARKFDAVASSMTVTPKRLEQIAFTDKVSNAPTRLVAKRGSGLQPTLELLKGKRIGVVQGSTQESYAKAVWGSKGVDVLSYQNQDQVYADLVVGRLDASLQGSIQASYGFLKTAAGKDYEFAGATLDAPGFFGVGDGLGLRKEDVALREDLNKALATILANGTYARINNKYFDFDVYGAR
ncbi:Histidine-binding periplasmic protein [Pseudomonas fluorescens]|uniref:Histidine-binding periplasmic protein n=1 Tax=Pseudomonas fluorescens TaxID=294 RepID=A0A8H2NY29_PSEFL|nr:ABC transporter substrate-binding protein [Pseudomonas fluorescens]VVO14728.1 Histidine-binding periplasmic protein [Pseudomonas fluorescens]VVP58782.1 Histidine-binding periplasmic protein [Pseudomonas fluorescens]